MEPAIEQRRLQSPLRHMHHHPSSSLSTSETSNASADIAFGQLSQPFPSFQDRSLASVPGPTPSRNIRKLVIDSAVALPSPLQQHLPIRRKPLSSTASPIATRYSSADHLSILKDLRRTSGQRSPRSFSVDSPTVHKFGTRATKIQTIAGLQRSPVLSPSALTDFAAAETYAVNSPEIQDSVSSMNAIPAGAAGEIEHPSSAENNLAVLQTSSTFGLSQTDERTANDDRLAEAEAEADQDPLSVLDGYNSDSSYNSTSNSNNMSVVVSRKLPPPPQLSIDANNPAILHSLSPTGHDIQTPNTDKPLPKSPDSSKLGNFFGWGSPSSTTEFSDNNFSPIPSPYNQSTTRAYTDASPVTTVGPSNYLKPKTRTGSGNSRDYCESYLATPPANTPSPDDDEDQIKEMEEELKAISAELASSIRREMDLEDLVDRLQAEKDNPTLATNRRTSDYFSDSGYSSAKSTDYDQSREEIERIQRRAEQDKAQVRLELTNKLNDERKKRQELDEQIKELSQKASEVDLAKLNNVDASDRVQELENTCETLRRKLAEERTVKSNFEDLLSALKGELQNASNERDNLRDEIVPQLRARVEGLENSAADLEKMTYESTKLQQELQSLKTENTSLKQAPPVSSISEEPGPLPASRLSSRLSRSSSITGPPPSFRMQLPPSMGMGLSRSKTVKSTESREQLSDRLKDVEEQRDALHKALRALLERQECQNRENEKKIRFLEMERDRLLTSSPGFVKEVSNLREEINVLRRRSEEALEQKWQVEKGLAGLKMDLDRAEQEIASLKSLLSEKDILIPESLARHSGSSDSPPATVTSESLMEAHRDLQNSYADALDRIKKLEIDSRMDERTKLAMDKLENALSSAVTDRDMARSEASSYKSQLEVLKAGEQKYLESEKALADELSESARRVEELALQVRQQLATNQDLRQRLKDMVARGEADQKSHIERIATMQTRLKTLEEQLVAAQTASEERIARHEDELSTLKESHNLQLSRLSASRLSGGGLRSPRLFPPKSPMSPMVASPLLSPRPSSSRRSASAQSVSQESQVATLKARVAELEKALVTADFEMQEVVGRMNTAQIEVMQLQEERETAMSQTRRLERELQAEKVKAFEDRFRTLQA